MFVSFLGQTGSALFSNLVLEALACVAIATCPTSRVISTPSVHAISSSLMFISVLGQSGAAPNLVLGLAVRVCLCVCVCARAKVSIPFMLKLRGSTGLCSYHYCKP